MSFTWDTAAYLSLYLKTKTEFLAAYPGCTAPAYGGMIRRIGWTVAVHDAAVKAAAERGESMPQMPETLNARITGHTKAAQPVDHAAPGLRLHMVGELSAEAGASRSTTEAVEGVTLSSIAPTPAMTTPEQVIRVEEIKSPGAVTADEPPDRGIPGTAHESIDDEEARTIRSFADYLKPDYNSVEEYYAAQENHKKTTSEIQPHTETAVLHFTDLHFGVLSPSPELMLTRLDDLGNRMAEIRKVLSGTPIDGLRVLMLGDLLDGEAIYPTQSFHQAITSAEEQAERLATFMTGWLIRQKAIWSNVEIDAVCGNHGRTGKDRNEASNFDRVFYTYLRDRLTPHGIKVNITQSDPFMMITHIHGWRFLMSHGNYIKAGGITPQGSIVNRLLKWNATDLYGPVDALTHGHFHQIGYTEINGIPVFSNGTAKQLDHWAIGGLGWESSMRWFFHGTNDVRKVTWLFPMALDEPT